MKKIAIVSSFSDSCGNAYFTKILLNSIQGKGYLAECAELDLKLTQSLESKLRNKAEKHIDKLCLSLKEFDGVNVQMEAGLYGSLPTDVYRRFMKISLANPNTSVTLHSPRFISDAAVQRGLIKSIML